MTTTFESTNTSSTAADFGIGGKRQVYLWNWQGRQLSVVYETRGEGNTLLLLPAFSTVSTRGEMRGIAELLAPTFQVVAVDWPGFGESDRPKVDYHSGLYHQFLEDFVKAVFNTPVAAIAAGHAAGYVMRLAKEQPQLWSKIVLAAPTWRGPFPTMGDHRPMYGILREIVRSPIVGQGLYKLNTTPSFLALMYRRHVYSNPDKVQPEFIQQKWQVTQKPGARFAPAAFVTGAIDPVQNRDDFLSWFQPLPVPVMVAIGEQSPLKSRAEMDLLATLPEVRSQVLPGSLGMHEEYPDALVNAIADFL